MSLLSGITSTTTAANRCKVKSNSTDTVCGYLANKVKAGTGITITATADATYGQVLEFTATPAAFTESYKVKVDAGDTAGYLGAKMSGTAPIVLATGAGTVNIAYTGALTNQKDVVATMTPAAQDLLTYDGGLSKWTSDNFAVRTAIWTYTGCSTAQLSTDYVVNKYINDLQWKDTSGYGLMYHTDYKTSDEVGIGIVELAGAATLSAVTTDNMRNYLAYSNWLTITSAGTGHTTIQRFPASVIVSGDTAASSVSAHASINFKFSIDEDVDSSALGLAALEVYGPIGTAENAGRSIFRVDAIAIGLGESYTAGTTVIDGTDNLGTGFFKTTTNQKLIQRCVFPITTTNLAGKDTLWVSIANYSTANRTQTCNDNAVHCATESYTMFTKARLVYSSTNPRLRKADYT